MTKKPGKFQLPTLRASSPAEARRRGMKGLMVQRNITAPPPTVPTIKAPTLEEIEAKYGKLGE